jgi:hypothetical protein
MSSNDNPACQTCREQEFSFHCAQTLDRMRFVADNANLYQNQDESDTER